MASRIQGITVEIGGDTTKLSKALESVNKSIKGHTLRDARQPGEIFHAHGLDALRDEQAQGLFDDTFLRGHDGMMGFTEQI